MKKKSISTLLAVLLFLTAVLSPCRMDTASAAAKIKVSKAKVTVVKGDRITIKVKNTGTRKVKAKVSDRKIVSVKVAKKKIRITGKKQGKTKVTLTAYHMKKCVVKVVVAPDEEGEVEVVIPTTTAPVPSPSASPYVNLTTSSTIKPSVRPSQLPSAEPGVKESAEPQKSETPEPTQEPQLGETPEITESAEPRGSEPPKVTPEPQVSETPESTLDPQPSEKPESTLAPLPGGTPEPTLDPQPGGTPEPTLAPQPSETPEPTLAPQPGETPNPTAAPEPSETPEPTAAPEPSVTAEPTEIPNVTADPTETPTATSTVSVTEVPTAAPTETPVASVTEIPTAAPTETPVVSATEIPTAAPTETPVASATEIPTETPTATPAVSATEMPTATPTVTPTVSPTATPVAALETTRLCFAEKSLYIGESTEALQAEWGEPDRIDPLPQTNMTAYIYNSNSTTAPYLLVGIRDQKVASYFTIGKGFTVYDAEVNTADGTAVQQTELVQEGASAASMVDAGWSENTDNFDALNSDKEEAKEGTEAYYQLTGNAYMYAFSDYYDGKDKAVYGFYAFSKDCRKYKMIYPDYMTYNDEILRATETQVLEMTNAYRTYMGLSNLQLETRAVASARGHSEDMAENNYYDHDSQDGTTFDVRMMQQGISKYGYKGENICGGCGDAIYMVIGWIGSSGHRGAILETNFKYIGVGVAYNASAEWMIYGTQDFWG